MNGADAAKRAIDWLPSPFRFFAFSALRSIARKVVPHYQRTAMILSRAAGPDMTVRSGPFAGMKYISTATGSVIAPKLLGTYEIELHDVFEKLCTLSPDVFVDVGSAEGYYAVGMAFRVPNARVICYDVNPYARYLVGKLAVRNQLAHRIHRRSYCSPRQLNEDLSKAKRPVVLVDIDGPEDELLNPALVPNLSRAWIVVETHDYLNPGVTERLRDRFLASHDVVGMTSRNRTRADLPADVELDEADALDALGEAREAEQQWLFMSPKHPDERQTSSDSESETGRPLRVMMTVTMFPKPGRETMGIWALGQTAAMVRQGAELTVVSMVPWVPRFLGLLLPRLRHWADTPPTFTYRGVTVVYQRWPFYQTGILKRLDYRWPAFQHGFAWLFARSRLRRLFRDINPDVIYAHHTWTGGDLAYRLHRQFGTPYFVTDHDFDEISDCERMPARRRYFNRIMRDATWVLPIAARMDRDIRRLFPGVRTTVLHNGSDPLPADVFQAPRPLELKEKIVVLCVAMLYPRKDVPLLIRAFDRAASRHPRACLRIVGDGDERAKVQEAIQKAENRDRIQHLGLQEHHRVVQEMVWADLFAMIARNEPWGVVYNEAMAAGLPILCANDGGINDVLSHEVHAITVQPQNEQAAFEALDRLLEDSSLRHRLGTAARRLFESSLTWDANAARLLTIFRSSATERPAAVACPPVVAA